MGLHDAQKLSGVPIEAVLDIHIFNMETLCQVLMKESSRKLGRPVETLTVIADCRGLNIGRA